MSDFDIKKYFFDDQNIINVDINELYNNYIKEIDSFRSNFSATNPLLSDNISKEKIDQLLSKSDTSTLEYNESRCGAFYRMLGLPFINSEGEVYSPGFDPSVNIDKDLFDANIKKINKITNTIKNVFNIREYRAGYFSNIFSRKNVNSTAVILATKYPRILNYFKPEDEINVSNQSYIMQERDIATISLQDDSGNSPDISFNGDNNKIGLNQHLLRPFLTDPRACLTVVPSKRQICAPFLQNKQSTQLAPNIFLNRPYIEMVISIRFNNSNQNKVAGNYADSVLESITSIPDSQSIGSDLLNAVKGLNFIELTIFNKLMSTLRACTKSLHDNIQTLDNIFNKVNVYPIPDQSGIEKLSKFRDVTINEDLFDKKIEKDIRELKQKKVIDEVNYNIGLPDADKGNYSFSGMNDIIFNQFNNVTKIYDSQIASLSKNRDNLLKQANSAFSNIEILTGEIGGIGLIDIIAINAAFWIIDKQTLLNMLDDNSFARMYSQNPNLRIKESQDRFGGTKLEGSKVMANFDNAVYEMLSLAQVLFDSNSITFTANRSLKQTF